MAILDPNSKLRVQHHISFNSKNVLVYNLTELFIAFNYWKNTICCLFFKSIKAKTMLFGGVKSIADSFLNDVHLN